VELGAECDDQPHDPESDPSGSGYIAISRRFLGEHHRGSTAFFTPTALHSGPNGPAYYRPLGLSAQKGEDSPDTQSGPPRHGFESGATRLTATLA
jgi:hypothetical protein